MARPMWCDDFDADLFKVIPGARELLAPMQAIVLYTHGHTTGGVLNHPVVWNGDRSLLAFFGFTRECGKPEAYVASAPVVECTAEEAFRDLWLHGAAMLVEGVPVWNAAAEQERMMALMYGVRGNPFKTTEDERSEMAAKVYRGLSVAVARLRELEAR